MGQQRWGIKECITYGLKFHGSNTIYTNENLAAQARAREAFASYLPTVNMTGSIEDNLKAQTSVIPAGVLGATDTKVSFTKKFNTTGTVRLDQTIYDQSLLIGLKARRLSVNQAELNSVQNNEAIIYNISNAYCQLFMYKEQLDFLKVNQQTYSKQLAISKLQVEKGVSAEISLNKVQVSFNNNLSEITAAESNFILAENQLKNAMGFDLNSRLDLDLSNASLAASFVAENITESFKPGNKIEYRLSEIKSSLLEIDQKRIQSEILPKFSFYGTYGINGFGDQLGPAFKGLSNFSVVGLKLSIPLFDGFKRGSQYQQARYKHLNSLQNLKLDEEKYKLDYENAKTKIVKNRTSIQNDKRNVNLAISVFKSSDLQYQKGIIGLTDWLNAQSSLKEAQNNYLNSLYNFYLAKIELEKANGTLLSFYNAL